jgi:glycosyltransferase involved in cell wall biosynthesis
MRVALVTSAKGWRGSGASYAKLAQGLIRRGHVAQLVTSAPRLTAWFRNEQLPVTEIPGGNTGIREVVALRRVLRSLSAQAVIVDTPRDLRLSAWAALGQAAQVVYRYNLNYRPPRHDMADRLYATRVAACVFQSEFIQQHALQQEPWVAKVPGYRVPNGYDTDRFAPKPDVGRAFRRAWDIPDEALVVATSAKLQPGKGHELAVAALDQVRREITGLVYLVCGDGALEEQVRALAAGIALPSRFTGLLDIDSIVAALNAADLVVHPSLQEIFPNAVGEAMACARAVIAADAGGTGELVGRDGSAGVLVRANDPAELAAAVSRLLTDSARRRELGAAARRRIESQFSLERMINGYEEALARVICAR